MSADTYIQMQVRLENLKAGEAQAIAKLLKDAQEKALAKLQNATTEWSRKRLVSQMQSYGEALDKVYANNILPELKADGLEFVAQNQAEHYQALVESVTGSSAGNQKAAAMAKGFDVDAPMYRGALKGETQGQFFAFDADYASKYGASARIHDAPLMTKVYLPKKGALALSRDSEIRERFFKEVVRPTMVTNLAKVKGVSESVVLAEMREKYFNKNNDLLYTATKDFERWARARKVEWSSILIDEQNGNMARYTRDENVAKSVYADFTDGKKATTASKVAASQNIGAAVVTNNLSPAAIYTAATAEPMQGKLMAEWATQLKHKEVAAVNAALKESWIAGESVGKSFEKLMPILNRSRRDIATITRTYYQHLASETQRAVWKENEDLMDGIIWDATLDNRTTLDICAPRDQLQYTLDGEPVGHNLSWMGGPGQAHWNCRSTGLPNIKGVDMTKTVDRRALGAGSNYSEGDNVTRTGRVRKNSADARERGIYKQQKVSPKTNYEQWLKSQPAAYQDDVLGKAKADAFRAGKYHIGEKFKVVRPTRVRGSTPSTQAIVFGGSTRTDKWNMAAFTASPRPIQELVKARSDMGLKVEHRGKGAHYDGQKNLVRMGTRRDTANPHFRGTWRHEMGHAVDDMIGGAKLPPHLQRDIDSIGGGVFSVPKGRSYRSGKPDYVEAMIKDGRKLESAKYGTAASTYDDVSQMIVDAGPKKRDALLKKMAKDAELDYEKLVKLIQQESDVLDDYLEPGQIGKRARLAKIITAIDRGDAENFYRYAAGQDIGVSSSNYRRGSLGYFSDLIGATTQNAVSGYPAYPGHPTSYYRGWNGAGPTENFANLTSLYGHENPYWGTILERFVPESAKKYKENSRIMNESKADGIFEKYTAKFDKSPPLPIGFTVEEVAEVAAEYIKKGEPIPDDYDWYADVPEGADV